MPVGSGSLPAPAMTAALLGGVCLGLAGLSPQAWPLAWVGVAASAFAMATPGSRGLLVGGLVACALLQRGLWLPWSAAMARVLAPDDPGFQVALAAGFLLTTAAPVLAALIFGLFTVGRRLPVGLWLPFAWVLGERVQVGWTSVATEWLFTQVDVAPVMGLLARGGMIPATVICLAAAGFAGEAAATRRLRHALPAGALALGIALMPPPPPGDLSALEGVGVVHLRSELELPDLARVEAPLELLIWPESIVAERLKINEGPQHHVWLPAFSGGETHHLVGAQSDPRLGAQNLLVHVAPSGEVRAARAKQVLLPPLERPMLGFGRATFVPGEGAPTLDVAGRSVVPLICGEFFTRERVLEGVHAGGRLLVVSASDRYQAGRPEASRQVLAHLRLRAVEAGVPAVYSSLEGRAAMVGPDGRVLALSAQGAPPGILTWSAAGVPRDEMPEVQPRVTVLYDPATPHLRPDCPPGWCRYLPLEELPEGTPPAAAVIVAGHGTPSGIGGRTAEEIAAAVAALSPELVILDACFSASSPLLSAVAAHTPALVVAVPGRVEGSGLRYDPGFFAEGPAERRALAVNSRPPAPLYVGRPDRAALAAAEARVATEGADLLRPKVVSWDPTAVLQPVEGGQQVLVPVDWRRIGLPPEPTPPARSGALFAVRSLWLEGPTTGDREELDAFLRCLIDGSTFADFFRDQADFSYLGSEVVATPTGGIDLDNRAHWLEERVPAPGPELDGATPLYLVFAPAGALPLHSACGYHAMGAVHHREAVIATVRTWPSCWPGVSPVRSETQIAMHEIAEGVDLALGHMGCVADGQCEGGGGCADPCDAFTGLACPGAPEETATGCGGQRVKGWAIQRLAHKGWEDQACTPCVPCDFTVELRPRPAP